MIAAACARRSLSDTPDGFENLSINAFFSASAAEKGCARQRKLSLLHLARFAPGPPSPLERFPACQQFLSQSLSDLLQYLCLVVTALDKVNFGKWHGMGPCSLVRFPCKASSASAMP